MERYFYACRVAFSILILFLTAGRLMAAEVPSVLKGKVNMQGTINDSACTIATGSQMQVLDMHTTPTSLIIRDGRGATHLLKIELVNCVPAEGITARQRFQVIFDSEDGGDTFSVKGNARGVKLEIANHTGNKVTPGVPIEFNQESPSADMTLRYFITLISNHRLLKAGNYSAVVRYRLNYF